MEIPKKVKVAFKEFDVKKVENLDDGKNTLYGQILYMEEEIKINTQAKEEAQKEAFLHELIHAIDDVYMIGLKEKQVERIATGLHLVMEQNKWVLSEWK